MTYYCTRCSFLHHDGIIQPDWIEQWNTLETWLNQYTPGWEYVQRGDTYCIDFVKQSDLTLYLLRWGN